MPRAGLASESCGQPQRHRGPEYIAIRHTPRGRLKGRRGRVMLLAEGVLHARGVGFLALLLAQSHLKRVQGLFWKQGSASQLHGGSVRGVGGGV